MSPHPVHSLLLPHCLMPLPQLHLRFMPCPLPLHKSCQIPRPSLLVPDLWPHPRHTQLLTSCLVALVLCSSTSSHTLPPTQPLSSLPQSCHPCLSLIGPAPTLFVPALSSQSLPFAHTTQPLSHTTHLSAEAACLPRCPLPPAMSPLPPYTCPTLNLAPGC